ncbi:MAG: hypothetical protein CJBNEKGG_03061 [Prosthecobacter sp.]|nr:hypothetical protein [Prosthecobacter sp.]
MSSLAVSSLASVTGRRLVMAGWVMAGIAAAVLVGGWLAGEHNVSESALTDPVKTQAFQPRPGLIHVTGPSSPAGSAVAGSLRERFLRATDFEAARAVARDMILSNSETDLRVWAEILLTEKDPARRAVLLEALDLLQGEASLEMITQLISLSGDADVTAALARTLGRAATPDTIQHLAEIHASAKPGSPERRRVLDVLGSITNPHAVPGLVDLAGKPSLGEDVTGRAITSLSKIGDKAAMSGLVDIYESLPPDAPQRPQIIEGIGSSTHPASRPFLKDIVLNNPLFELVTAAKKGLQNLPEPSASSTPSPR